MTPSVPRDPQLLRLGTAVMTAQGVGLFAAALYLLVRAFTSPVHSAGIAALDVVCALVGGLAFAGVARGLRRLSAAARTPGYILEFLCLPIGVGLFQGHQPAWGVLVLGSALLTIGLLIRGLPKITE
jgi:hypothetical protein